MSEKKHFFRNYVVASTLTGMYLKGKGEIKILRNYLTQSDFQFNMFF